MISIAMTSFNGEKYIEAQLKSFKTQTLLPDEVIICDDFSNDYFDVDELPYIISDLCKDRQDQTVCLKFNFNWYDVYVDLNGFGFLSCRSRTKILAGPQFMH